ncbi:hypothetical protein TWF730_002771 [Orbilia blumenaviensis]|uniref:Btz domain-containing protein n=1 Tax=Orbilia blumenaviensis TaxID=1796055 RepID=A0AAV9U9C8_9PEZI
MPRRKDVGLSRRRVRDEDEAEIGDEGGEVVDDSASDSGFTDDEFDDDNESEETYSDDEHAAAAAAAGQDSTKHPGANGPAAVTVVEQGRGDTHVMMNGIRPVGDTEAVDFDELAEQDAESRPVDSAAEGSGKKQSDRKPRGRRTTTEASKSSDQTSSQTTPVHETQLERKRREAEEYRKKRDADPAFVPNRGAFFMHDHRSESAGGNGFRPFGRGRGRNAFNSFASSPDSGGAWKHDMHDEIVAAEKEKEKQRAQRQAEQKPAPQAPQASQAAPAAQQQPQPPPSSLHKPLNNNNNHPPNRFFDTTVNKGNVQIRVSLPGMKEHKVFDDFAVKIYTKLPYHRPPLRRDKPVRISLPESLPRYIYPAISRSFVFIPRAMRPGGSGFTRGGIVGGGLGPTPRRGSLAGSYRGGMQTGSVYGGTSTHAPSVAMSRRSSIHQDFSRPPISFGNIPAVATGGPSPSVSMRPVVRLPVVAPVVGQVDTIPPHPDGFVRMPAALTTDGASNPLPHDTAVIEAEAQSAEQKEGQQGHHVPLPMHQPKPQKTVSVENIETPVTYNFANTNYPTPGPYSDGIPTPGYYNQQHNRVPSYPSQTSTTPHLPDQAIHARPFQPTYPQPGYYYPIPPPAMYPPPPMHAQPPMSHQPQGPPPPYVPSAAAMPYVPQTQMPGPPMGPPGPPMGTIAQESNGTVYYYDSTQLYPGSYQGGYMPPVAMVPPTSAPPGDSQVPGAIHANGMYYYPQMVPVPMVPQGPVYYG